VSEDNINIGREEQLVPELEAGARKPDKDSSTPEQGQVDHTLNSEVMQFFNKSKNRVEEENGDAFVDYLNVGERELSKIGDPRVREKITRDDEEFVIGLARVVAAKYKGDKILSYNPDFDRKASGYDEACHLCDVLLPKVRESDVSKSVLGKCESSTLRLLGKDAPITSGVPEELRALTDQEILETLASLKDSLAQAIEERAVQICQMEEAHEVDLARGDLADSIYVLSELDAYEKQLQRKLDEKGQLEEVRGRLRQPNRQYGREIYTGRLIKLLLLADQRAADATYEMSHTKDSKSKVRLREKRRQFDRISNTLFELTSLEGIDAVDIALERLEKRKEALSKQDLSSRELREELARIEEAMDFLRATTKPTFGEFTRLEAGQLDLSLKRKKVIEEIKAGEISEPQKEIERLVYLQSESLEAKSLEIQFRLLNEYLIRLQEDGGDRAIQEFFLPMINSISRSEGLTGLTLKDIDSMKLVIYEDKAISSFRGGEPKRAILVVSDRSQFRKISGDERVVGFMQPFATKYVLPSSGVEDLPIIFSSGYNEKTIRHEMLHSTDEKSIRMRRKGFDRILEEAYAYFGETILGDDGLRGDWGARMYRYFKAHSSEYRGKAHEGEFHSKVHLVIENVRLLQIKLGDSKTVLRLLVASDTLDDFFDMAEGILHPEAARIHKKIKEKIKAS